MDGGETTTDRPRRRRRRLSRGRKLAFAGALLLLPLPLLEGGLRLAGWPTDRVRTVSALINFDRDSFAGAVGMLVPNAVSRVSWPPELAYTVHVNALGLRGPDVPLTPREGIQRILMLGDSFVFGYYVEEDETLPAQLQAWLAAEGGLDEVEVINGGCGGWSIDSQTLFLEERALALQPDVVVLGFCCNDVADLQNERSIYEAAVDQLGGRGERDLKGTLYATATYEVVLRAKIAWKRWRQELRGRAPHPLSSIDIPDERVEPLWGEYAAWLERLTTTLHERGIPLVVVFQPDPWRLANDLPQVDEARLAAICERLEVPFVSALAGFEERPPEELFHLPLDGHPNREGHRVTAAALGGFLVAERETLGLAGAD